MNILIAEDDRSFRKGLVFELADAGYKVTEAEDGRQAIDFLKQKQFDLVISDLMMPKADGLEVYRALQRIRPETKFILLTAFIESKRAKEAQDILKDNIIRKPFPLEHLSSKITHMLT